MVSFVPMLSFGDVDILQNSIFSLALLPEQLQELPDAGLCNRMTAGQIFVSICQRTKQVLRPKVGRKQHFKPPLGGSEIKGPFCGTGDLALFRPHMLTAPRLRDSINNHLHQTTRPNNFFRLANLIPPKKQGLTCKFFLQINPVRFFTSTVSDAAFYSDQRPT